jgi:hypothetical protein
MIRPGALPLYQQILTAVFFPPVGAVMWWLMSRGWAMTVQGGAVSERTKRRQKIEFWVLLMIAYALSFAIIVYARFT